MHPRVPSSMDAAMHLRYGNEYLRNNTIKPHARYKCLVFVFCQHPVSHITYATYTRSSICDESDKCIVSD